MHFSLRNNLLLSRILSAAIEIVNFYKMGKVFDNLRMLTIERITLGNQTSFGMSLE